MKIYDVAIIGAGPIGLFAGFQVGTQDMQAIIIDSLEMVGGQCSVLYPEKFIYDIPGHKKITAQNLVDNLKSQCDMFGHDYLFGTQITELTKDGDIFILNKIIYAKTIIIAAGCGSFNPNKPSIDGLIEFEDTSVFYLIDNINKFKGKRIAIAGGGDSAVDWSLMLMADIAEKIYFIHRREDMRCHPNSLDELRKIAIEQSHKFEFKIPYVGHKLIGSEGRLSHISIKHFEDEGDIQEIEIDYFLPFFGLKSDLGAIKTWGLDIEKNKILVDYTNMQTNIDGIYAIGDICEYIGKTKLLISGFHEAGVVSNGINQYLIKNHNKQLKAFSYSTSKFN